MVLALLMLWVNGLEIAVNSVEQRCMIVYTVNEEDHLKVDIKFPRIHVKDEQYGQFEVQLLNT